MNHFEAEPPIAFEYVGPSVGDWCDPESWHAVSPVPPDHRRIPKARDRVRLLASSDTTVQFDHACEAPLGAVVVDATAGSEAAIRLVIRGGCLHCADDNGLSAALIVGGDGRAALHQTAGSVIVEGVRWRGHADRLGPCGGAHRRGLHAAARQRVLLALGIAVQTLRCCIPPPGG